MCTTGSCARIWGCAGGGSSLLPGAGGWRAAPAWLPAAVFLAAAAVEAAQYFQLGARLHLDTVPVIRVILGSVFDWMDILCYAVGAGLCALWQAAEPRILSRKTG